VFGRYRHDFDNNQLGKEAGSVAPNLIVSPYQDKHGRANPNKFQASLEGETAVLCVSSQPFLDGARILLDRGLDPDAILVMQHAGSDDVALHGSLGKTAMLTVDEHNGTVFARWKPFSLSAGPPRIANNAPELPDTGATTTRRKRERPRAGRGRDLAIQKSRPRFRRAR
jgi:hypothetical protein